MFQSKKMGITLSYVNTFLSMVFGIILSSYLIRALGDTEYGVYQTVTAFANYLLILELGTGTITQRNVVISYQNGDQEGIDKTISTMWLITIILSLAISVISIFFYCSIDDLYRNTMSPDQIQYAKKIFFFFMGNLLLTFLTQTLNGYALGVKKFSFAQITRLARVVIRTVTIIGITVFYRHSIVIAAVDFLLSLLCFLLTFNFCRKNCSMHIRIGLFDRSIIAESLPLCLALLLQSVIQQANNSVDKVIIGSRLSVASVAVYSVAQQIYAIFISVMIAPVTMYLPQVAENLNRGLDKHHFTDTLIQPTRLISLISGTILFGFIAVGRQFIIVFYGKEKLQAWIYALILIVPLFLSMTNGVVINVLDITKRRLVRSLVLFGITLVNIILTWIWVNRFGVIGAVMATAITMFVGETVILNIYYDLALNIEMFRLYRAAYHRTIPILAASSAIAYWTSTIFSSSLIGMLTGGCLYVAVASILLYMFSLTIPEKLFVSRSLNRFRLYKRGPNAEDNTK